MNQINLRGLITNIQESHILNDVEYDKADLIVKRKDGKEDIISLCFKRFSNTYQNDQEVELTGNIRSYSRKLEDGKNKVSIYVFTYMDKPETLEDGTEEFNHIELDGRVCRRDDDIRITSTGKQNFHLTLANNIISTNQKINNYIPIVLFGKNAIEAAKLKVSDKIKITGQLHSREYKKTLEDGSIEIRVAHEVVATSITKID